MLSSTVNVASLGAMIHSPRGHKSAQAPSRRRTGRAVSLYLRLNFMCFSARAEGPARPREPVSPASCAEREILRVSEIRLRAGPQAGPGIARCFRARKRTCLSSAAPRIRRSAMHRGLSLLTNRLDETSVDNAPQVCASLNGNVIAKRYSL